MQSTIAGIGASQQQSIADTYAQQSGNITQQMTNSGLGNTTAATSAQGVASLNEQKASVALANQIAQLNAGYQVAARPGVGRLREPGQHAEHGPQGRRNWAS